MSVGICGYGAYVPRHRITVEEIARVWNADAAAIRSGLGLREKTVPMPDEDTVTMAVESARRALARAREAAASAIGGIYVGSESHPYAVKPSGTIVAAALGVPASCHVGDIEFACKGGTEAMFLAAQLVQNGAASLAMAIGSDTAQAAPGDALEYSAAAGAAAFLLGRSDVLATLDHWGTFVSDTPDFWRRQDARYPRHAGRFSAEPAYFHHVASAARTALAATGLSPRDFTFAIFHQPNGKFPLRVARQLGFTEAQIEPGLLVSLLGNTYSAASLLGLTAVLDIARPGDRIFLCSYGSGAGSDAFVLTVTEAIADARDRAPRTRSLLERNPKRIDYAHYTKVRRQLVRSE